MSTTQVLLFALLDFVLVLIAWILLHPAAPLVPALVVKPAMIRIPPDEVHYDKTTPGTGKRIHHAQMNGYYFFSQSGNVVTYRRDEMFVPAGAW